MKRQSPRQRFQQIVGVLAKYGLKEGITSPSQLRQALEELGPTFVKIAQVLSTRPDIIPDQYIQEFQKLQDDVKPVGFQAVREIVEAELGDSLDRILPNSSQAHSLGIHRPGPPGQLRMGPGW